MKTFWIERENERIIFKMRKKVREKGLEHILYEGSKYKRHGNLEEKFESQTISISKILIQKSANMEKDRTRTQERKRKKE